MPRSTSLRDTVQSLARHANRADISSAAEFLEKEFTRSYPVGDSMRLPAEVSLDHFARPVELFLLRHYPAAYMESYALIESFALTQLPRALHNDAPVQDALAGLLARRTLSDLAPVLVALKRWDENCHLFVKHLTKVRNALAHGNHTLLDRAFGKTRSTSYHDWEDARFTESDTVSMLLDSIEICLRIWRFRRNKPWRPLRFQKAQN